MKIKLTLILILCMAVSSFAQEPKPRLSAAERKAAREKRAAERKSQEAKLVAALKERAAIFDLQFYTDSGGDMQTFEVGTAKGTYRYEFAKNKKLIEGSGVVKVDGCTLTLTDWPRVVATANVCSGSVRAWIERERFVFTFVDEEECSDCEAEDDSDEPDPAR